jgi:hypothetical protein
MGRLYPSPPHSIAPSATRGARGDSGGSGPGKPGAAQAGLARNFYFSPSLVLFFYSSGAGGSDKERG